MKICSCCDKLKPYKDFGKRSVNKDRLDTHCRVCRRLKAKKYYNSLFEDKRKEIKKKQYWSNRQRHLESSKKYYRNNKDKKSKYDKVYRKKNKKRIAQYKNKWEKERRNLPVFKIKRNLRRRIHHLLINKHKSSSTFELIGCSAEQFKDHIESLFTEGMSWDNYGFYGWHIDHIIPCCSFDLTQESEQKKCFHYSNQRPMWAKDNLVKGSRLNK